MGFLPSGSTPPASYRQLITLYENQYNDSVARGDFEPYVWPYRSFGVYVTLAYLLLPPTRSRAVFYARYPVFAFLIYWSLKASWECRSATVTTGYGIGLLDAWSVLWLSSLLIFNDARGDFKRIEYADKVENTDNTSGESTHKEGNPATATSVDEEGLRNRCPNGSAPHTEIDTPSTATPTKAASSTPKHAWQSLPPSFPQRLDWVCDLVSNFRGLGWSHRIASVPSPPPSVLSTLHPSPTPTPATLPTGISRYSTARAAIRKNFITLVVGYLALDAVKVAMMADPYFWGLTSSPPPSYLPTLITSSPVLTRTYRLVLSLAGAYGALQSILALAAPFFIGVIGSRYLGLRAEPWQYPDHYGNYSAVFRKGLAGWWGTWWHQTFRFAFEAPQKWMVRRLGWDERGRKAKMLGLVVAFTCSGCLHAGGSSTLWPATQPLRGPFAFFVLQPVGILLQMGASHALKRIGLRERLPGWVRGLGNFVAVHVWFYYTAPLLTDDFARGGIWLFEAIPDNGAGMYRVDRQGHVMRLAAPL